MPELTLRDYQEESIKRICASYKNDPTGVELLVLPPSCHRAGQGILMYDGSIKTVENIQVGDILMGPDSTPRTVQETHVGHGSMIEVVPACGQSFVISEHHVLSLMTLPEKQSYPDDTATLPVIDIPAHLVLRQSLNWQKMHQLFRTGVNFPQQVKQLPLHPYILGVLLGDETLTNPETLTITTPDQEIVDYLSKLLAEQEWMLQPVTMGTDRKRCQEYRLSGRNGSGRPKDGPTPLRIVRELQLPIRSENRFIPQQYKTASEQERLQLLAGIIDTEGFYDVNKGQYELSSKSHTLAEDICFLARSLGFAAYSYKKELHAGPYAGNIYYQIYISGPLETIPVTVLRKKAPSHTYRTSRLRQRYTLTPTGTSEQYYGFALDGDHRYLLDDFTVTHNSGKTIIFTRVIKQLGGRALILAHRDELLDQAAETYHLLDEQAQIGKIGNGHFEWDQDILVGSVATLRRPNHCARLAEEHASRPFTLVVCDEAHHIAADGYQQVLAQFQQTFRLLVTATPDRLDGKKIIDKSPIYELPLFDMMTRKWIAHIHCIAVKTTANLDTVTTRGGDYRPQQLSDAIDTPARNQQIVDTYLRHTPNQPFIAYCVTVAHAKNLAAYFTEAGIPVRTILGETPTDERLDAYTAMRNHTCKGLINVDVLTEGFNMPIIRTIIMARPTQSRTLYYQAVTRGGRLSPGKTFFTILDFTDNCLNHRLQPQTLSSVLNLPLSATQSEPDGTSTTMVTGETVTRKVDNRRRKDITIDLLTKLNWTELENGNFALPVLSHRIGLIQARELPGYYTVVARLAPGFELQRWSQPMPLGYAQQLAERKALLILADKRHSTVLVDRNADWRTQPPTEKQIELLTRFRRTIPRTKGEAADLLDQCFEKMNQRKKA